MSEHPPWRQTLCQGAKATGDWKVPTGPGGKAEGRKGSWTHSEGPTPVPSQLCHSRPQHIAQTTATEKWGEWAVRGGRRPQDQTEPGCPYPREPALSSSQLGKVPALHSCLHRQLHHHGRWAEGQHQPLPSHAASASVLVPGVEGTKCTSLSTIRT